MPLNPGDLPTGVTVAPTAVYLIQSQYSSLHTAVQAVPRDMGQIVSFFLGGTSAGAFVLAALKKW